jgi:hypothetical protein
MQGVKNNAAKTERSINPPSINRRKLAAAKRKKSANPDTALDQEETHSFIGEVPFQGVA